MSDFLTQMSEASLLRARLVRERAGASGLASRVRSAPDPLPLVIPENGFDVIAEAKLSSPSEGSLAVGGVDKVVELARIYEDAGALAISVLTEESKFGGTLDHLTAVADTVSVPAMRKDFLVDPIQIDEARAAGASGVLLIARILDDAQLAEMTDMALSQGMFVLVEVFDENDIERASLVFDRQILIGVNCRNLASLEVDPARFVSLAELLPSHLPAVAESGISAIGQAAGVARIGYRLALVGSSLVKDSDPGQALASMIASGRRVGMAAT